MPYCIVQHTKNTQQQKALRVVRQTPTFCIEAIQAWPVLRAAPSGTSNLRICCSPQLSRYFIDNPLANTLPRGEKCQVIMAQVNQINIFVLE